MPFRTSTALLTIGLLAACANMPTQPSQITGTFNSGIRYEQFDCERLTVEKDNLSRREQQLALAQEQRIRTSQVQAFWLGYGQGDGIEASELASVRGELNAVNDAMRLQNCP